MATCSKLSSSSEELSSGFQLAKSMVPDIFEKDLIEAMSWLRPPHRERVPFLRAITDFSERWTVQQSHPKAAIDVA